MVQLVTIVVWTGEKRCTVTSSVVSVQALFAPQPTSYKTSKNSIEPFFTPPPPPNSFIVIEALEIPDFASLETWEHTPMQVELEDDLR